MRTFPTACERADPIVGRMATVPGAGRRLLRGFVLPSPPNQKVEPKSPAPGQQERHSRGEVEQRGEANIGKNRFRFITSGKSREHCGGPRWGLAMVIESWHQGDAEASVSDFRGCWMDVLRGGGPAARLRQRATRGCRTRTQRTARAGASQRFASGMPRLHARWKPALRPPPPPATTVGSLS